MRLTIPALWTLSILSISSALSSQSSSDSSGGRRRGIGDARSNSPRLSSISSSSTSLDSIARKRKAPGAPLVDSALLRFVSKQKKEQEKRVRDVEDRSALSSLGLATDDSTTTTTTTTSNNDDRSTFGNSNNNSNFDSSATTTPTSSAAVSSSPLGGGDRPIFDPWMGQFNHNRIAQKLISLGAAEEQALEAGKELQNYVLIRTARRRIRRFLRERDSFWNDGGGITTTTSSSSSPAAEEEDQLILENNNEGSGGGGIIPGPSTTKSSSSSSSESLKNDNDDISIYGFDDVLDVFVENGFTGTDIAATLIHTPGLALMTSRKSSLAGQSSSSSTTTTENAANGANSKQNLNSTSSSSLDGGGGETLEHTIERAFHGLLLNTLGMRKYDARKVVRTCPGLLSVRGSKSAVQMVAMMTQLGVSTNSIARDKPNLPTLLSRPPADVFRLISFLSSSGVRMPIKAIGPLIRRLASRELLDTIAPVRNSQRITTDVSAQEETDLESAMWSSTRAERTERINHVYRNMTETILTLRNEIGAKDLGKVIAAYPSVLLLDAKMKILPTATYLTENLGIEDDLASVLQMYPILLGMDIEEFEKVSSYLVSLGVEKFDLTKILRAFPALLTLDVEERMVPVVEYLVSIGVDDIGMFVTRLPPVLGYSVEDELKPKWEYLNKVCLQAKFELKKFPAYFSYPFDRVIKTRYDYLAAKEIPRQLLPVDTVLRHGDIEFATKIARDVDGGKVFRAFSENRKRSRAARYRNANPNRRKSNPR